MLNLNHALVKYTLMVPADYSSYFEINKKSWNSWTPLHVKSAFYAVEEFVSGKNSLNEIELVLLGDVKGKEILHLQCHFGQDSISLARMGANVTAVDFSEEGIEAGKKLAKECNVNVEFICSNIFDLDSKLNKKFDIVFTSYGVIAWLPELKTWGETIAHFLKPSGVFIFAEFHPVLMIFDDGFKSIIYDYFHGDAIMEKNTGSYAEQESELQTEDVTWNHSTSDVINSLLESGLSLYSFNEYDYSPYNCFNGLTEEETGKFRIENIRTNLPMVFSLKAIKK